MELCPQDRVIEMFPYKYLRKLRRRWEKSSRYYLDVHAFFECGLQLYLPAHIVRKV